jgi:hypothetical protein
VGGYTVWGATGYALWPPNSLSPQTVRAGPRYITALRQQFPLREQFRCQTHYCICSTSRSASRPRHWLNACATAA